MKPPRWLKWLIEWLKSIFPVRRPAKRVVPGPNVVDGYNLFKPIGRGSYGEVWLARSQTDQWYAIKFVARAGFPAAEPYDREFDGLKRYEPISRSSPNMLHVLHVNRDEKNGRFYYVMERADDISDGDSFTPKTYMPKTLRAYQRKVGMRLPVTESARIAADLTEALARLHGQGIIHRDIKPENVVFVKGIAKLGDIGCCSTEQEAQSYVGTKGYIPPEGPGTQKADIYALGKVFYEMVTAKPATDWPSLPIDLVRGLTKDQLAALQEVVNTACHPQVQARYASAEDFARALQRLRGTMAIKKPQAYLRSVRKRAGALLSAIVGRR